MQKIFSKFQFFTIKILHIIQVFSAALYLRERLNPVSEYPFDGCNWDQESFNFVAGKLRTPHERSAHFCTIRNGRRSRFFEQLPEGAAICGQR